jgi:endo-1,4-beta-D-glucanase Y
LAEAFEKEVRTFCQSSESVPELPFKTGLIGLYRKFIESKYDIYQEEKFQVRKTNVIATEQRERDLKIMRVDHQLLALKVQFNEETVALFQDNGQCIFSDKELSRIGIVQLSHDGKPHFIHRTFAEYYVADCLVNRLTEGNNTSEQGVYFILRDIFMKGYYQVIRVFIDSLLSSSNLSDGVLKYFGNRINDFGGFAEIISHRAACEGNAKIFGFLLESAQAAGHTEAIRELLLGKDKRRETAWNLAAEKGNVEVMQKIWEWAEEKLTREEIKNNLLSHNDRERRAAWQVAAYQSKLDIMHKIWEWAEEKLTTEEIKKEMLLRTDDDGRTVWQLAVYSGNLDIMQKIWEWAEEKLTTEEIKSEILLRTDREGRTAWKIAEHGGKLDIMLKILELAEEKLTTEEIKNEMLIRTDCEGKTTWKIPGHRGKLDVMLKIWELVQEKLTTEEMKNEMLLPTGFERRTDWQLAVYRGKLDVMLKIWEWAEEKLTTEEIKNEMLLHTDREGRTAWHVAAYRGTLDIMQKIWEWAKDKLTPEEIKKNCYYAQTMMEGLPGNLQYIGGT